MCDVPPCDRLPTACLLRIRADGCEFTDWKGGPNNPITTAITLGSTSILSRVSTSNKENVLVM